MSAECAAIHHLMNGLARHHFPFNEAEIPVNGIYVLFQKNETGHDADRIVRVGTHTGEGRLRERLAEHFLIENKDRSIFRKNIGRALLNMRKDSFLEYWNLDLTSRKAKDRFASDVDHDYQKKIEKEVSKFIRKNFSFSVIRVDSKTDRINYEAGLIATISLCDNCKSSEKWIGRYSTKRKIVDSGLWQEQKLYGNPVNLRDIEKFLQ